MAEDRLDAVGDPEARPVPEQFGADSNRHEGSAPHASILSLGQASRAAGLSKEAIRRRLRAGRLPNASRTERGSWLVPVTDLLADGLRLEGPSPVAETALAPAREPDTLETLRTELDQLRSENAILRERLAMTELIAAERQERIDDLRLALHMLPEVWAQRMFDAAGSSDGGPTTLEPGPIDALPGSNGDVHAGEVAHHAAAPSDPAARDHGDRVRPLAEVAPNPDYWGRESTLPPLARWRTKPIESADDPEAKIQGLRLALELERAENSRLSAEINRRRWWPFRRSLGRHRRGTNTPPP